MTNEEVKSCIGTIEMLRRLAYNIHGVMDVIDADNCEKIIKVLSDIPKYKDAYNKGWDDGAKASYEHLKMCEEEQSGDLISRQAVDDAIYDYSRSCDVNYAQIMEYIDKLPSVNPQEPKWIPVGERLPEHYQNILFSTKTNRVFEGRYFKDETEHQWYSFRDECFAWNNVVTAWMPLPEPYKAESEVQQ